MLNKNFYVSFRVPYIEEVSIRLLSDLFNDNYNKVNTQDFNEYLPTTGTFQIQGEIVLLNKLRPNSQETPISTTQLTQQIKHTLDHTLTKESEIWKYIEEVKRTFVPAVKVHYIRPVDQPLEVIKSHLYMRLMTNYTTNLSRR